MRAKRNAMGIHRHLPRLCRNYTVAELSKFYKFVRDKVIREVPVELVNKYPNVKEKFENNEILQEVSPLLGGYYWNPRPKRPGIENVMCAVLYRKDWAEVLGFRKNRIIWTICMSPKGNCYRRPGPEWVDDTYGLCTTRLWQLLLHLTHTPIVWSGGRENYLRLPFKEYGGRSQVF